MKSTRTCVLAAVLITAVLALGACSDDGQTQQPPEDGGDSIGTTTPPGEDVPTDTLRGAIGDPVVVGEWTVLVREAEFEDAEDATGVDPGTVEETRPPVAVLKVEVELSHDADQGLRVYRTDWAIENGAGRTYPPIDAAEDASEMGEREIGTRDTEDVTIRFEVPRANDAYMLRFEPLEGGPGVARIAIP